jgi:hypothetical protein
MLIRREAMDEHAVRRLRALRMHTLSREHGTRHGNRPSHLTDSIG